MVYSVHKNFKTHRVILSKTLTSKQTLNGMYLCDPKKYRHLIDDPSLTDERKDELILGVWVLMEGLVKKFYTGQIPGALLEEGPVSEQILTDFLEQGQHPCAPVRTSKKRKPSRKNSKRTKRDRTT